MMTTSRSTGSRRRRPPWRTARRPRGVPALGYASASAGTALDGPEIEAQRLEIESACHGLGLELVDLVRDHEPEEPGAEEVVAEAEPEEEAVAETVQEVPPARPSPEAAPVEADAAGAGAESVVQVRARETVRALGYASVPADAGGKELAAQNRAIQRAAGRLRLDLVEVIREREPKTGKALDRAGLSYLIERLATGDASCIVVTGLERLSRSVAELGTIEQWLERNSVRLVSVDLDLDTASPGGQTTARALASVGGWERERLSERTRKGLAAARAKRRAAAGPAAPDWEAIKKRIAAMRAEGMTLQAIADVLNKEGVPTQRGGAKWRPSSVQTAAGYKRRARSSGVGDLPEVDPRPQRGRPTDPNQGPESA